MANFNKVILAGNLTRDPELRYTPRAPLSPKIAIAVNRTWKSETGENREEVTFVDVDAFGRQAETIGQYLKKGRPILIEGRLRYETWEDKQTNQKRSRLGVVLENFQFLDSGRAGAGSSTPTESSSAPASRGYRRGSIRIRAIRPERRRPSLLKQASQPVPAETVGTPRIATDANPRSQSNFFFYGKDRNHPHPQHRRPRR